MTSLPDNNDNKSLPTKTDPLMTELQISNLNTKENFKDFTQPANVSQSQNFPLD